MFPAYFEEVVHDSVFAITVYFSYSQQLLEKENKVLKEKLAAVQEELEDANKQMTKLAGDSSSLHHSVCEQQGWHSILL